MDEGCEGGAGGRVRARRGGGAGGDLTRTSGLRMAGREERSGAGLQERAVHDVKWQRQVVCYFGF